MQIKFGTDGWRGVIACDYNFDTLSVVAQATMDYLNREGLWDKGLIIGYDRRFMSVTLPAGWRKLLLVTGFGCV